jgi:hypothetical protein
MTILNDKEKRYLKLDEKAQWEPLTDEEFEESEEIMEQLGIIPCETCRGEGWFSVPSILGYGYEEGACKSCEGTGTRGQSPQLHKKLVKIRSIEPRYY